ncbi:MULTISPECIES: hypothetical protein [unclassified Burkholderia]|uniref:hypothetical protein n=1 Tax=unclassified Burkholderia TaxID=2613784 RepID=UPI0021500226|nr:MULTISPECIES: hypothetical protein [unclassified Burkholderia]MCR4469813.1 hypothetical protein [Burkholderia sp. SCN-KJ]
MKDAPALNIDSTSSPTSPDAADSIRSIGQRVGNYVAAHLFEASALALTLVTGLAYVVGRSYLNGWEEAAGVPGLMFRRDLSDVMLAGATVARVWMMPVLSAVAPFLIMWVMATVPEWMMARWPFLPLKRWCRRARRVYRSGIDQIGLRQRYAVAAYIATRGLEPQARRASEVWWRWKVLGARHGRTAEREHVVRPRRAMRRVTFVMLLAVVTAESALFGYTFFVSAFLDEPRRLGRENFAKIYLAVTGRVPYQYGDQPRAAQELQAWACEGRAMLSYYRAVILSNSAESSKSDATYYLLQGADHTFMLLGEAGSVIRSLGDAPFSISESSARPLSHRARRCESVR